MISWAWHQRNHGEHHRVCERSDASAPWKREQVGIYSHSCFIDRHATNQSSWEELKDFGGFWGFGDLEFGDGGFGAVGLLCSAGQIK